MADNYRGSSKLVTSSYLYKTLYAEDQRVNKKLHNALYIDHKTTPMHYVASAMGEDGALIIVADGALVDSSTEIEKSTVNANKLPDDLTVYNIGDYVKKVEEVPAYSEEIYLKQADLIMETEELDLWGDVEPTGAEPIPDEELDALYNEVYNKVFGTI